jgi:tagaturonate epimerase
MKVHELFRMKQLPAEMFEIELTDGATTKVHPRSIIKFKDVLFFIAKTGREKFLYLSSPDNRNEIFDSFDGMAEVGLDNYNLKKCMLNHANVLAIQKIFTFTRPVLIGIQNSFGFGDRLGLANAGHLQSLSGSNFRPVLAQQSIRELTRTQRQPEEVMDAAVWAVMQEGYQEGFGADADHLKTTEDIDRMVRAGYTMFTIDPGDHVDNRSDHLKPAEMEKKLIEIPWKNLDDSLHSMEIRYLEQKFDISSDLQLHPEKTDLHQALVKYGKALSHIKTMANHLQTKHTQHPHEIEVSVDETESVTTPFEHFFIANELMRLGIDFISLAPRFIGSFEKGIDYKGDIEIFRKEYAKHLQITRYFGTYKISLHSGSDKFSVYRVIGSFQEGHIHVKTAGTSYLEALRVIAAKVPDFFRQILDFSKELYETEKKSYHVSVDLSRVPDGKDLNNKNLLNLFNNDDARQVLHVTFGRVLTEKDAEGNYMFRVRILDDLKTYEDTYNQFLREHFRKHLEPFRS